MQALGGWVGSLRAFTMHAELSCIDAPHGSLHHALLPLLLLPQGKVLYQNASSLEYMGDLLSGKYDGYMDEGLLQVWGVEVCSVKAGARWDVRLNNCMRMIFHQKLACAAAAACITCMLSQLLIVCQPQQPPVAGPLFL